MDEWINTLHWFLPLYMVAYLGIAFLWRSYLVWKRTGINPYALGRTDSAHDFVGLLFRLTIVGSVVTVMIFAFWQEAYRYLTPIAWLITPPLTMIGLALLFGSLVWIVIAQVQMGSAWRIGIDTAQQSELVQHGLFRISRNPIFLGMRITLLGLFLVLPSAASFAIFVLGDALTQVQVRLEEEYLMWSFGDEYQGYRQRTPRWL